MSETVRGSQKNVIDVFCGAGGLSHGFKKEGYRVLLGVDKWETAVKTFAKNNPDAASLAVDVKGLDVKEIKKLTNFEKIQVVVGGPPCQGFSMAGARNPTDPRNTLFMEFVRIVDGIHPEFFVMENVRGILSLKSNKDKRTFGEIIVDEFKKIGYDTDVVVLNAADYGVPQKRFRVFFIGRQKSYPEFIPQPKQTHSREIGENGPQLTKWVSVSNTLVDIGKVPKKYFYSTKMRTGFLRRMAANKKRGIGFGWQFLKSNEPSYTISARYWKDGAEALVKYSNKKIRRLMPIECARIQSFEDDYFFTGSEREVYEQVGNAVPPLLASGIARHLKSYLR